MGILKTLSKRRSVFFIVLILAILVIISGIFLFKEEEEYQSPQFEKHVDDFIIEGNVIKNEKEGLTITIPDGWTAEKEEQVFEHMWGVNLFSSDIKIGDHDLSDSHLLNNGCIILINIQESNIYFESIIDYLKSADEKAEISLLSDENKKGIIKIGNKLAWKEIIINGERIDVRIPLKNDKLVYFIFILFEESCYEDFSEFLKNVEINI